MTEATPDDVTLSSPTTDTLKDFYTPLLEAFSEDWSPGEFEAERDLMEPERLVNAFDGERRIGSAGAFSMRLTVPGGAAVPASGITAVGVSPDHRRRGVLRRMMRWLLDDAIARHEPLAMLWASEAAIYQRFGFGLGTLQGSFEADKGKLVFRDALPPRDDARIRMVDPEAALPIFPPLYEATLGREAGGIRRPELLWKNTLLADAEWMRHGNGPKFRAVLEVGGEPRGYVIYRMQGEWSPRGPLSTLHVVEVAALDPDAERRLWQWVASMDLVATVKMWRGPVPHPLQLWLQEPRRLGLTVSDGMWIRFVDVAAALGARTYAGEGSLVLELSDPLIEANAGRWQLIVDASGVGSMTRTTAQADVALDVAALACTYLGAVRFGDLARAGRVHARHASAVETADRLFTTSRPPFANTMF